MGNVLRLSGFLCLAVTAWPSPALARWVCVNDPGGSAIPTPPSCNAGERLVQPSMLTTGGHGCAANQFAYECRRTSASGDTRRGRGAASDASSPASSSDCFRDLAAARSELLCRDDNPEVFGASSCRAAGGVTGRHYRCPSSSTTTTTATPPPAPPAAPPTSDADSNCAGPVCYRLENPSGRLTSVRRSGSAAVYSDEANHLFSGANCSPTTPSNCAVLIHRDGSYLDATSETDRETMGMPTVASVLAGITPTSSEPDPSAGCYASAAAANDALLCMGVANVVTGEVCTLTGRRRGHLYSCRASPAGPTATASTSTGSGAAPEASAATEDLSTRRPRIDGRGMRRTLDRPGTEGDEYTDADGYVFSGRSCASPTPSSRCHAVRGPAGALAAAPEGTADTSSGSRDAPRAPAPTIEEELARTPEGAMTASEILEVGGVTEAPSSSATTGADGAPVLARGETAEDPMPTGAAATPEALAAWEARATERERVEALNAVAPTGRVRFVRPEGMHLRTDIASGIDDPCAVSAGIGRAIGDGGYNCAATRSTLTAGQLAGAITTGLGTSAVATAGGVAQSSAAANGGGQAAQMMAAADTQEAGAWAQMTAGLVNLGLGGAEAGMASDHGSKSSALRREFRIDANRIADGANGGVTAASGSSERLSKLIEGADIFSRDNAGRFEDDRTGATVHEADLVATRETSNESRLALQQRRNWAARQVTAAGDAAAAEQQAIGAEATAAGVRHLAEGAAQFAAGVAGKVLTDQMRNHIRQLESDNNRVEGQTFDFGSDETTANNGSGSDTITGTGADSSASSADDAAENDIPGGLGDPFNTAQPGGLGYVPAPSGTGFVDRAPGATAPGGGAGGGAASAGAPPASASAAQEDPQSKYMDLRGNRSGNRYEMGGVGRAMSGGGGGGGGGSVGPDLSKLMEKFMGKNGEGAGRNNGILDFGGANGRAGEAPYSLLDRNANIFERIHQTYQDRSRRGVIGL